MIDFGESLLCGDLVRLRRDMSAVLFETAAALAPELRNEAWSTLRGYTDGTDDFFRLFYTPVWSFLHWAAPPDAERRRSAVTAHALALFLHLWDDHLCDGQLALNPACLHLRTLAWQRFESEARAANPGFFDECVRQYFASFQNAAPAGDLDEYVANAERRMAIWYVVPGALGGESLQGIVARFSRAWRLVDDVQDEAQDSARGILTAVSFGPDPIARAARELREAIAIARDSFPTIARELEASLAGLGFGLVRNEKRRVESPLAPERAALRRLDR